ncbi:putative ribonuclease H-like domain-containing protein, partial [Tanacetum coccineum]
RKVEENLHIRFLEDKPIIAGDGPKWLFDIDVLTKSMNYVPVVAGTNSNDLVGTEESIGIGHYSKETRSSQDYILMPLDAEKKHDEGVNKESGINDQERPKNNTQDVYTVGPSINTASTNVNTGGLNINTVSPTVITASLEAIHADFFGDETKIDMSKITATYLVPSTPNTKIHKDHSLDHVIGDVQSGEEPQKVIQALKDPSWIEAMHDELLQFKLQKCNGLEVCYIDVSWPYDGSIDDLEVFGRRLEVLGTCGELDALVSIPDEGDMAFLRKKVKSGAAVGKLVLLQLVKTHFPWIGVEDLERHEEELARIYYLWNIVYTSEIGIIVRNKARLVAQGYTQKEGIYYDEVFAPVASIEAIRLFLAYASFMNFVVYQMDMKSAFLYGKIEEEVYVCQPLGFEDTEFLDRVYKVEKPLYGLHQTPRASYETLSTYLFENGFQRGTIDKTLFIKKVMQKEDGIFISQDKYVGEILKKFSFSTVRIASTPMETSKPLLKDAKAEDVDVHLYRSMIGTLMYLTSSRPDIMFVVCACARFQVTPKVSHLHAVKRIFRHLKGQPKLGLWYPKNSPFNLEAYSDSDYAGAIANSTTEAEYVAVANCCGQVLWIQNQMLDYGYNFMNTKIFIDNESTICIVKNPVFHSKTKHIEIRHHFIRDSYEKRLIQVIKIHTDHNVADLLTKALDVSRFQFLTASIGMLNL